MSEPIQQPGSKSPIINIILKRLWGLNLNFICLVTGPTGSGKSYAALRFAEQIDPSFHIGRVCFSIEEFFELYNKGELTRGRVVIIDEAGAALGARRWNTEGNKDFQEMMQTFRHRNFAVIFNVPSLSFIDIAIQRMAHAWIQTRAIDRKNRKCLVKFFWINYDDNAKKIFTRYHVIKMPNGIKKQIRIMRIGHPENLKLVEAYERKKKAFTAQLGQKTADRLDARLNPQPKNTATSKRHLIEAGLKQGLTPKDLAIKYDVSRSYVRELRVIMGAKQQQ